MRRTFSLKHFSVVAFDPCVRYVSSFTRGMNVKPIVKLKVKPIVKLKVKLVEFKV